MTRSKNTQPNGAAIRSALGHPVIDSGAHVVQCEFGLIDTLKEVAGPKIAGRFGEAARTYAIQRWQQAGQRTRPAQPVGRPSSSPIPPTTPERPTALRPALRGTS